MIGLLVLVHPVLSHRFFFTVDGPAHVYNASLILQGLAGSAREGAGWEWNPVPVPNWLGHALLAVLLIPFKAPEALKIVHLLYLIALPLALRALAMQHAPGPPWSAHLILPIVVQVPFSLGFYNFCLGLVLFVLVVQQVHRINAHARNVMVYALLALLMVLLYFSHLVPFAFALVWLAARMFALVLDGRRVTGKLDITLRTHLARLTAAIVPSLLLSAWYYFGQDPMETWAPPPDRLMLLYRSFLLVDFSSELFLWAATVGSMLLLLLGSIAARRAQVERSWTTRFFEPGIVVVALVLQVLLPNDHGKGSDILMRMAILTHLCVMFWLIALPQRGLRAAWASPIVLAILVSQQVVRQRDQGRKNERLSACYSIANGVVAGSSVAFISFDWLDAHLPELAFADRAVLDLSNYEFINPHFPLRWSDGTMAARANAPAHPLDLLEPWSNVPGALLIGADHILVVGSPQNDAQRQALDLLRSHLHATHQEEKSNGVCALYSLR